MQHPATIIRPQPGPQEQFLASPADIVIYGGAAGGGKTWSLLIEPLRHLTTVPGFGAVIFRRETPQIRNPGALWDASEDVYSPTGLRPKESVLEWEHKPTGNAIKFSHLEHEKNVHDWQGSEIPLIEWDELTHFTAKQFWYMLSRNRSTCGVRPYMRATCNPDPDSFVADLIAWWIDQNPNSPTYGDPIPERAGIVRWFVRIDGTVHWAASPDELRKKHPGIEPKSLTFIPSSLNDNPALTSKDPGYRANLMALDPVEQARLLRGNWKAKATAGTLFQRGWVQVLEPELVPAFTRTGRAWDLAGTKPTPENPDPDWTVSLKGGVTETGLLVITDATRLRENPGEVEHAVVTTTQADGRETIQRLPEDPGQAGKAQSRQFVGHPKLHGHTIITKRVTGSKVTRFGPASARAYKGLIAFVRAPWNEWVFAALEAFPDPKAHDDVPDALSDLVDLLTGPLIADANQAEEVYGW